MKNTATEFRPPIISPSPAPPKEPASTGFRVHGKRVEKPLENKKRKLTATLVRQIRSEWADTPQPNADQFGKRYGVSVSTIKAVLSGKTWKSIGDGELHHGEER